VCVWGVCVHVCVCEYVCVCVFVGVCVCVGVWCVGVCVSMCVCVCVWCVCVYMCVCDVYWNAISVVSDTCRASAVYVMGGGVGVGTPWLMGNPKRAEYYNLLSVSCELVVFRIPVLRSGSNWPMFIAGRDPPHTSQCQMIRPATCRPLTGRP